jgi:septum formation protein
MASTTLILASRSFGRQLLLRNAGFQFIHAAPPFDDPPRPATERSCDPEQVAMDLARCKAESFLGHPEHKHNGPAVILSADTIIAYEDGELAGKPVNRTDADRMIRRFLNATHRVITGVALIGPDESTAETFADTARVQVGHVEEQDLQEYLNSGSWHDKAGGYNLFDRRDAGWPISVQGDPTTVVGLPMQKLGKKLLSYGVRPDLSQMSPDRLVG